MIFRQGRPVFFLTCSEARRWLIRLKKQKVTQSHLIQISSCGSLHSEVILVQVNEINFLFMNHQSRRLNPSM